MKSPTELKLHRKKCINQTQIDSFTLKTMHNCKKMPIVSLFRPNAIMNLEKEAEIASEKVSLEIE